MKIFYVDYENVKDSGLNGIAKLDFQDVVRIYYSEDANKMTFGTHRRIIESPAKFEYVRMHQDLKGVKNALDVILMKEMSERMIQENSADFYIVSADGDFDNYIQEKKKRKISISKITEVCQASKLAEQPKQQPAKQNNKKNEEENKKKEQAFRTHFGKFLKDDYEENKEDILDAYMNAKSRQELNNNLQQYFYNDAVSDILSRMSALIKNMPGR